MKITRTTEQLLSDQSNSVTQAPGKMRNWLTQNKNELADVEKHWQRNGLFRKKKEMNRSLLIFGLFIGNLALLGMLFFVA